MNRMNAGRREFTLTFEDENYNYIYTGLATILTETQEKYEFSIADTLSSVDRYKTTTFLENVVDAKVVAKRKHNGHTWEKRDSSTHSGFTTTYYECWCEATKTLTEPNEKVDSL